MITIIFILIVAMAFAFYMHQRLKIRREGEHERRMERFENLMEVLKKKNSGQDAEKNNTTKNEQNSPGSDRN